MSTPPLCSAGPGRGQRETVLQAPERRPRALSQVLSMVARCFRVVRARHGGGDGGGRGAARAPRGAGAGAGARGRRRAGGGAVGSRIASRGESPARWPGRIKPNGQQETRAEPPKTLNLTRGTGRALPPRGSGSAPASIPAGARPLRRAQPAALAGWRRSRSLGAKAECRAAQSFVTAFLRPLRYRHI